MASDEGDTKLEILREFPGRVVRAERDGTIHMGRNYDVLRSEDAGETWTQITSLPRSPWRRAAEVSRLACRLLRQEVRALARLSDGSYVASNREGVSAAAASTASGSAPRPNGSASRQTGRRIRPRRASPHGRWPAGRATKMSAARSAGSSP